MSVPQRQILADYLRDLRPLRPLRMMRSLVEAATCLQGEAAIPYSFARIGLTAVFTATLVHFVHVVLLGLFASIVPLTTPRHGFNPSLSHCQVRARFASFQLFCCSPWLVSLGSSSAFCACCSHHPTCFKSGLPSALGGGAAGCACCFASIFFNLSLSNCFIGGSSKSSKDSLSITCAL